MNKEERITYEEFMIMFKNAPRIAYTLYDKAEDEIDRLNNIKNKTIHKIQLLQMDGEVTIKDITELVNILKGEDKE